MMNSAPKRFPVTVSRLPVTRCQLCHRTIAYRPGEASAVLTKHYNEKHKDELEHVPDAKK